MTNISASGGRQRSPLSILERMTYEEIVKAVGNAAAIFKLVCGVGNNAAWVVMMEGYDHARRCKAFRKESERRSQRRMVLQRAVNDFNDLRAQSADHPDEPHVPCADMSDDVRRKYGNISDAEYYEFWKGVGGVAYAKTKPLITSLVNKYRVSLVQHDVKDAEHVAWVMTAQGRARPRRSHV